MRKSKIEVCSPCFNVTDDYADAFYWTSPKGYHYRQLHYHFDDSDSKIRRVSEHSFQNMYEMVHNY
ncbi:MAG: hypothetical protein NC548_55065 [Lachnospiraceae bacterium]|nr:hypothetical protein [Lachnospiraceae bacterium]